MYNVSQLFKDYNAKDSRNIENRVLVNGIEYLSSSIFDLNIQASIISGEEFTIGTVIPKRLNLKVKTSNIIPVNAMIQPFVRLNGSQGPTEWVPLGVYYIDNRANDEDIYTLTCYDKLIMTEIYLDSSLTYPNTMRAVYNEIIDLLDIESLAEISNVRQIPYKLEEITVREMLGYIASAHGGSFTLNNDNKLVLIKFNSSTIVKEINLNEYYKVLQSNPLKTINSYLVTINDQQETILKGSGESDNMIKFTNPFIWIDGANTGLMNEVLELITTSYTPCRLEWKGSPEFELGDLIKINLKNGTSFTTRILNQTFSFKGGMKSTILSPSVSEQTSEFNFKSLMNKIRKGISGLQEDEVYYGVSIGRQYGLKISRSDGFSEVLLNSDVMSFRAKNEQGTMVDRIYFDPISGNYIFDGLLSATAIEAISAEIDVVVSETVIVNNLYASRGRIAELTVDHLLTGDFLKGDESLFYIEAEKQFLKFMQAQRNDSLPMVQYTTRDGALLFWTDEYQKEMHTAETDYPVMVYQYDAIPVMQMQFEEITDSVGSLRVPTITLGRGDGATPLSSKGRIYKDRKGMVVEYFKSNSGDRLAVTITDDGIEVPGNTGPKGLRNIAVGATPPTNPQNNDLWIDTMGGAP